MKILKQFLIISSFSLLGILAEMIIPFKIPASVLGLIFLFLALQFKLIKTQQIKDTSQFLIDNMAFLFVPLTVGLMNDWGLIKTNLLYLTLIMIITTTFTMVAVALVSERIEKN